MPIRDILLDDAGNRVLQGGTGYGFADGTQAVKQGIACRVRLFRGEVWLDEDLGVDYLGRVFVRGASPAVINGEVSAAIAATPDVTAVRETSFAVDAERHATIDYTVSSTAGTTSGTVTT